MTAYNTTYILLPVLIISLPSTQLLLVVIPLDVGHSNFNNRRILTPIADQVAVLAYNPKARMAFLNRRTTVMTTSSSNSGHPASSSASLGIPSSTGNSNNSLYSSQRGQFHSNSIMKRVSTMFTPKKKSSQDTSSVFGIGHEASNLSKQSRKKDKSSKSRRDSVRSFRASSESDLEDLEEIRQPNDLGPPAPSIYSAVREEDEEHPTFSTPKKQVPEQQKRLRRFSIQSLQSLLSAQPSQQAHSASSMKRRSISHSIHSSLHSKNSSLHSESYAHSLHSLSQSLLEEEAELIEGPKFQTATKATIVSAIWAGPTRASSVPNLGSFIPATPPPFTLSIRRKPPPRLGLRELPVEIIAHVFKLLPRRLLLGLAPLSKNFSQAAQLVIYETLDLRNISSSRQDELDILLTKRQDLTEITRELICDDRPSLYHPSFPSALILAHMTHLTTLTLPSFSLDLMQHHTAFGLRSVTFLNTDFTSTEKVELLTWLDGQVNITTLSLPRLFDSPPAADLDHDGTLEREVSHSPVFLSTSSPSHLNNHFSSPPSPRNSLLVSAQPSPTLATPTPFQIPLPPSPGLMSLSNSNLSSELITLCTSSTLLPHLGIVRAPPSILQLLAPSRARTLRKVGININDTLVGGLRPAELVGFLKASQGQPASSDESEDEEISEVDGGLEELYLNFGRNVDRRTVEKVLSAAGAALGGFSSSKTVERGRVREEKDVESSANSQNIQEDYHPPGLQSLEIAIPWNGPRTEEMLYKTIHSILPRYRALYTLVMRLSSPLPSDELASSEPQVSATTVEESLRPLSNPLPAVQVNGQPDADQTLEDVKSDETDALLSPTDTNENSVDSEHYRVNQRHSYASSSQISLASGGTAPSAGSIVSLTMFPNPPSSLIPIPRTSTPTNNGTETALGSPKSAISFYSTPNRTSESPTLPSSPTPSTAKSKNFLGRLPSLKKRGKRADTDPLPPLPRITTQLTPSGRSATLPIPIPVSPISPRTPTIATPTIITPIPPSTDIPVTMSTIPNTPTTPRMPSTPSTPRCSQFVQTQPRTAVSTTDRWDDDLPTQRWETRRVSSMTTSALSVSSSIRGVDWNHGNSNGNGSENSGPSSPRTPVPDTPTMVLTDSEKKHVRMWIRQCPTLRRVVFISGAEWGL
ncbi:uncharacterized protein C8R40DRAFT_845459 [Lentinula edodes]|uniref:uncharacterized protein n=1 Tax=Lentinula edodes TaxID=5353 RepID=UPI001E8D9A1F|nr:uncharacterized protein C8R40DRAFT_845459 [Lentinula edodes]KAH7868312.1 hypothetical protein C8R40DRAFT_845459 [Lentinula edodes]